MSLRELSRPVRKRLASLVYKPRPDDDVAHSSPAALRRARPFFLSRECALLGRAGDAITPIQRAIITSLLDARFANWQRRETPLPPRRDAYLTDGQKPSPTVSATVVMSRYINNDPLFIDSDFYHHFSQSAADAGIRISTFDADGISYAGSRDYANALAALERLLIETRPDIVPATAVAVSITDPGHLHGLNNADNILRSPGGAVNTVGGGVGTYTITMNTAMTGITASGTVQGGGGAHNNVQPTIILNKIIYTGVYS